MKDLRMVLSTALAVIALCVSSHSNAQTHAADLVDAGATRETKTLFYNLRSLAKDKILFGHQK